SLAAKVCGEFGEETIHGDGWTSEELGQQLINSAAFAGRVVFLQIEQRIDLPCRHALIEHRFALRFGGNVYILRRATGVLRNFLGEFRVRQSFWAIQLVGFAAMLAASQSFCGNSSDVADIEVARPGIAHRTVENALCADARSEIRHHILMETIRSENGERNPRAL